MEVLHKVIKQFSLKPSKVEGVPDSFSSTVYKMKLENRETVYVKIPFSKLKLKREYTALERFQGKLPVPRVLDYWEGDEELTGALLLSAVDGVPVSGTIDAELAFDIGVQHAKLHAIVPEAADRNGSIPVEHGDWTSFLRRHFYSFAEDVKDVLEPRMYEQTVKYFEKTLPLLPVSDGPCYVHMDFRPANILMRENRIAGIIDFESIRIGASQIDFTKLNRDIFLKFPSTMEAYRRGYEMIRPLIPLEEVLPFYRITDAFNSIGWCNRRGLHKHRDFYDECCGILGLLLKEYA